MSVSFTIMAHKQRRKFVEQLKPQLDGAGAVWDRKNDRWDTGRRALLAYDKSADWHVVVQDDAILCPNFLPGVEAALASVPLEVPVSFYTGKTRPFHAYVKGAVEGCKQSGKTWFTMRGPLWGPAIALPTVYIDDLVADCDRWDNIPNYDLRIGEWFTERKIQCWYSVPSLVDHRVGEENPSLVKGRYGHDGRVAFEFIGDRDPTDIAWDGEPYVLGDPTSWWSEEGQCTRCGYLAPDLAGAILHSYQRHGLGPVNMLASTPYHAQTLHELYEALPREARGNFYTVGENGNAPWVPVERVRLQKRSARNKLRRGLGFTIVGAARDFHYLGNRPGWSVVGGEAN